MTKLDKLMSNQAMGFAKCAHRQQKRKYTGEPYAVHCENVARIVAEYTDDQDVIAAACLHDVLEDTEITPAEMRDVFGERITLLVLEVTDVSRLEDGNRQVRKAMDREHIARSSPDGATIKLADLIDNTGSIVQHDKGFARSYLREKEALLELLKHGNAELWQRAFLTLQEAQREMIQTSTQRGLVTQARILVRMQFGSHVYGTNVPTSDLDFKAVHVPAAEDILLGRARPSINQRTKKDGTQKNGPEDVDFESFTLQKFMAMLLEGQTVALSMLFTPEQWIIERSPEWDFICEHRHEWLHHSVSAFAGYCRQQANKYGIRGSRVAASRAVLTWAEQMIDAHGLQEKLRDHWPQVEGLAARGLEHVAIVTGTHADHQPVRFLEVCNRKIQEHATFKEAHAIAKRVFDEYGHRALLAETNQGVDWKACMHAVRVSREAEELLLHHTITYPRPEADLLLAIRKGELPYKEVAEMLEDGLDRLEACAKASVLPERGNHELAEKLIFDAYRTQVAA